VRHPIGVSVRTECDGSVFELTSTHIDASGMRVVGAASIPHERALFWNITLPGSTRALALPGTIIGSDANGLEVAFSDPVDIVRGFFRSALIDAFPQTIQAARLRSDERSSFASEHTKPSRSLLSIVVPVYNEGEILGQFHAELGATLTQLNLAHEIIYVDDGSHDDTAATLRRLADATPIRIVSLSRNFGHQAAVLAGLEASRGAAVITIDGDMQQPPSLIGELVERWRDGNDIVNTIRRSDKRLGLVKRATSRLFYVLFSVLSTLDLPAGAADFRLLDRNAVDILLSFQERHFFLRGLAHWIGFRSTYVEYAAAPRRAGTSKFTLVKMIRLASDGFFSFSAFPLRLVLYSGLSSLVVTFGVVLYVTYAQVRHLQVPGWSSLLLILSFFSGLQLLGLGVVAEYVGRIFTETKKRPRYLASGTAIVDDVVFRAFAELVAGART